MPQTLKVGGGGGGGILGGEVTGSSTALYFCIFIIIASYFPSPLWRRVLIFPSYSPTASSTLLRARLFHHRSTPSRPYSPFTNAVPINCLSQLSRLFILTAFQNRRPHKPLFFRYPPPLATAHLQNRSPVPKKHFSPGISSSWPLLTFRNAVPINHFSPGINPLWPLLTFQSRCPHKPLFSRTLAPSGRSSPFRTTVPINHFTPGICSR